MNSVFGFDSIGIVASDKEVGSKTISVFPIEHMADYDGVISDGEDSKVSNTATVDSGKGVYVGEAERGVSLTATWINLSDPNRVTAPDVRKGESVILYRFGNADKWFWGTKGHEADLRRRESVVHVYGNTEEHGVVLNETNTYYTVISTIDKVLHIHAADNDGEVAGFDVKIDMRRGLASVVDSNGNYLKHDAGGKLDLSYTKEINLTAPKITMNGEVLTTKNVRVAKKIYDELGNVTDHQHAVSGHAVAVPR